MEQKKIPFFVRLKNAVFNFDEYKTFVEEKVSTSIKYILKLLIIFVIVVTAVLVWKCAKQTQRIINYISTDFPEFTLSENTLFIESDNKRIINGDENHELGFIVDSEAENIESIEEANDYQLVIAFLKNKVTIRGTDDLESTISYEQINQTYNIDNLNKSQLLEILSRKKYNSGIYYIYSNNIYLSIYNIFNSNTVRHTTVISSRIFVK